MTVQILRSHDRRATPWKNGGGATREIAAYPPGAGLDDFDWRVSMATVSVGGPFSLFPGVDRILMVLEGRLTLRFADGSTLDLSPDSPAARFLGDVAVVADTPARPVTDLNVMTRRGRFRVAVSRVRVDRPTSFAVTGPLVILALSEGANIRHGADSHRLDRLDAALIGPPQGETAGPALVGAGEIVRIQFRLAAAA